MHRWVGIFVVVALLCACSKEVKAPQGPSAASLDRKALMQAVFPGWTAKGKAQLQNLQVRREVANSISSQDKGTGPVAGAELVKPLFVVRLADDQAVMVTETHQADEHGAPDDCHACSAGFGAYQFQRDGERWVLTKRDDVFVYAGSHGTASANVIKLASNMFALAIESGGCWQGYCGSWLDLFELTPAGAHSLTGKAINVSADNGGASTACDGAEEADAEEGAVNATGCFQVQGKWAIDASGPLPGALTLSFTGSTRNVENGKLQSARSVDGTQVLKYQAGKYVVVSGVNPVPSF